MYVFLSVAIPFFVDCVLVLLWMRARHLVEIVGVAAHALIDRAHAKFKTPKNDA